MSKKLIIGIICCLFLTINCLIVNILSTKKSKTEIIYKNFPNQYLGEFTITYYCPCKICVGNKTIIKTATGTEPIALHTIAVDPKVVPLKSIIFIEGIGYCVAEDTGIAIKGRKIDVFVKNHQDALNLGKHKSKVYLMK